MLKNCHILYTRPENQQTSAHKHLQQLGAKLIPFPLIDTQSIALSQDEKAHCHKAQHFLFTSANAVKHFFKQWHNPTPKNIAIGKSTALALEKIGEKTPLTAPPPYSSESLLKIYKPQNKTIAIIAAEGGRTLLQKTLEQQNHCQTIYAYKRILASHKAPEALKIANILFINSAAALNALSTICTQQEFNLLQYKTCLIALSPRIADLAKKMGFKHTLSSAIATEDAQIATLCHYWQQKRNNHD